MSTSNLGVLFSKKQDVPNSTDHDTKVRKRGRKTMPTDTSNLDQETLEDVETLARFADENPNPILRVDASGTITYANERSGPLLTLWDTDVGGRIPAPLCTQVTSSLAEGTASKVTEDCGEAVFEISLVPIVRDMTLHLYCVDITDRIRAEEKVRSLARFPDENPNPVLRADSGGNLIYSNAGGQELLTSWAKMIGQRLPARLVEFAAQAVEAKSSQHVDEVCGLRTFRLEFSPIVEAEYVNIYARDITVQRAAEAELREAYDEAVRASDEVKRHLGPVRDLVATNKVLDEEGIAKIRTALDSAIARLA